MSHRTAILLLTGLAVFLLGPVLFFKQIFLTGDTIHFSYPAAEFFKKHYLSGLNPYLYLGFPLASSFHYAYFNPMYLVFLRSFDFLIGYHLVLLFDLIVAGLFCYFLLVDLLIDRKAAVVGTITYLFSQFSTFWLASITISNGLFLFPALLWVINKLTNRQYWYGVILPFIFGYAFLSVHYQFIVMTFVGSVAFLIYQIWDRYDLNNSWLKNTTPFYVYIAGLVGGFVIGWPQIYNTLRFFPQITRSDFITYDYLKFFDPVRYVLPDFNVFKLTSQEFLPYIGIVSLILVLIALTKSLKSRLILFSGTTSFVLISAMVKYSPMALLFQQLPIFKYFAQPVRWLVVGNLFLAVLASIGFKIITNNDNQAFFNKLLTYLKIVIGTIIGFIVLINYIFYLFGTKLVILAQNYFDKNLYADTTGLPLDYYHQLITILASDSFYNVSILNPNVINLTLSLLGLFVVIKYFRNHKQFSNLVIVLIVVNLVASFFINTKFAHQDLILTKPKLVDFILKRDPDVNSFRVFSYGVPDAQYKKIAALNPRESLAIEQFSLEGVVGNTNQLSLIGGLEPNGDKKVQELVYFYLNDINSDFSDKLPLLSALNTKYLITPYLIKDPNLILLTTNLVTEFNIPIYLYENKKVLPRVYLPDNVEYIVPGDDKINLDLVLRPNNNFSKISYVECLDCQIAKTDWLSETESQLSVLEYKDEYIKIKTNFDRERWMVVANANVLGWNAYINGAPTKIYPANYALQAIYVPAGESVVEFKYETSWLPL